MKDKVIITTQYYENYNVSPKMGLILAVIRNLTGSLKEVTRVFYYAGRRNL